MLRHLWHFTIYPPLALWQHSTFEHFVKGRENNNIKNIFYSLLLISFSMMTVFKKRVCPRSSRHSYCLCLNLKKLKSAWRCNSFEPCSFRFMRMACRFEHARREIELDLQIIAQVRTCLTITGVPVHVHSLLSHYPNLTVISVFLLNVTLILQMKADSQMDLFIQQPRSIDHYAGYRSPVFSFFSFFLRALVVKRRARCFMSTAAVA